MQCVFVLDHLHFKSSVRRLGSNEQCYEIKNSIIGETALQLGAHLTTLLAVHDRFGQYASSKLR